MLCLLTTSIADECDCFGTKLEKYSDNGCYTYNLNNDCDDTLNKLFLATCPSDTHISTTDIEDKLRSISPKFSTNARKIDGIIGLEVAIDSNSDKTFTICFDRVNDDGVTSDIVFFDGEECDFQTGLPCFG